jgi:hypothetical protein
MLKTTSFSFFLVLIGGSARAQVTLIAHNFQNNMAVFQATALPGNELDKSESSSELLPNSRRTHAYQKPNAYYFNISNRTEKYPEITLDNVATASSFHFDYVRYQDKRNHKIGIGLTKHDLQFTQLVTPYLNYSIGLPLNDTWQFRGGLSYRVSKTFTTYSTLGYEHKDDDKITRAFEINNAIYHSIGLSAATVYNQNLYIGIGMNRLLSYKGFVTTAQGDATDKTSFTELNGLVQWAVRKSYQSRFVRDRETGKKVEYANHGLFSNINLSIAARYGPISAYPWYVQFNVRTSVMGPLWVGTGFNTAKKIQFQLGWMQFPVFRRDVEHEYHLWIGYDLPTRNTPYQGYEINLGYSF